MELRYLEEAVDSALSGSRYENDVKRLALVAISLSEFLTEKLNDVQRDYLHSAKMFWSGNLSEEKRIEFVRRQGHVVDFAERKKSTDTRQASVERLVWAGLLTTTPLTSHAGEFLIDLAKDAGLSADEIFSAFEAHVPELGSYRP